MNRWAGAGMVAVLAVAGLVGKAHGQTGALVDPKKALAVSAATGRPVLAIAGSTGCIYCKEMAAELAGDPQVQPLGQNFVVLLMDTDTPPWQVWKSRYTPEDGGIPKVFVVRADGELVYNDVGKPFDMKGFLTRQLDEVGTIPEPATLLALEKAAREAQQALRRRDTAEAVRIAAEQAGSGSYAAAAVALDKLAADLAGQGTKALDDAVAVLKDESPEQAFEGALQFAEARRIYGALPAVKEKLDTALTAEGIGEPQRKLVAQAEQIDQARQQQAARQWDEALAAYQKIVSDHAGTPAAAVAQAEIPEVQERMLGAASRPATTAQPKAGTPPRNEKRAKSYLHLGQRLIERGQKDDARSYLKKAIASAPDTETAKEAQKILDRLTP